jgi:hypothetical protein
LVDEKDGRGGVECAGYKGDYYARVFGKGVGELEAGEEEKGAPETEEEVGQEESVHGANIAVGHEEERPQGQKGGCKSGAYPSVIGVEDVAGEETGHVGCDGGGGEEEVETEILLRTFSTVLVMGRLVVVVVAGFMIDASGDEYRLESRETKDDSGREDAKGHREHDLD